MGTKTIIITELIPEYDSRKSFYRKAIVIDTKDHYTLMSYDTEVFRCDKRGRNGKLLWTGYSLTTYRHIREFIRQYCDLPDESVELTLDNISDMFSEDN